MLVEEDGISPHIFNAVVIPHGIDNLVNRQHRITSLHKLAQESGLWDELVEVVERTYNISKGIKVDGEVKEELLKEEPEKALWDAYENNEDKIKALIKEEKYAQASKLYHQVFAKPAHLFFEKVFVNVEDLPLRNNRILLNQKISRLYTDHIADLSRIPRKK